MNAQDEPELSDACRTNVSVSGPGFAARKRSRPSGYTKHNCLPWQNMTTAQFNRFSTLPMHGSGKELGTGLVQKIKKDLGLK